MLIKNTQHNTLNLGKEVYLEVGKTYNMEKKVAEDILYSHNAIEKISYTTYHATNNQCPVCFITLKINPTSRSLSYDYECLRCGNFSITHQAKDDKQGLDEKQRAYLSHKIRWGLKNITSSIFEEVKNITNNDNSPLTSLQEQINNLISYLFEQSREIGDPISLKILKLEGIMGANQIYANSFKFSSTSYHGYGSVYYVLKHLEERRLIDITTQNEIITLVLSIEGWEYYEKLRASKSEVTSDIAFFALQFPKNPKKKSDEKLKKLDKELGKFYEECKKQLQQIGIKLINPLLEEAKNGNISNRLENEIIKAKFLIADLSHDNSGAYWEAGFAHGLNKKVFYTCCEERQGKTHFDVNQHYTIFWNNNDIKEKAEELKNAVKRSFTNISLVED